MTRLRRVVHAVTADGWEVVQYPDTKRYWLERVGRDDRVPVTLDQAVEAALVEGTKLKLGQPCGMRFDTALINHADWPS